MSIPRELPLVAGRTAAQKQSEGGASAVSENPSDRTHDIKAGLTSAPNQPTTDEALVRAIADGDRRAMRVLFARHNVRIFRFVARLLGDGVPAEDLVSEVFLDVWRKAHLFEGRSQVSTWLLGIARNKALSARRRRAMDHLDDETAQAIEDPADSPYSVLEKKDEHALVRKALTQLSPAHREIIDLIYYHGKSMEEVAVILQIPQATVRTRMFYARKRLAALLTAWADQAGHDGAASAAANPDKGVETRAASGSQDRPARADPALQPRLNSPPI